MPIAANSHNPDGAAQRRRGAGGGGEGHPRGNPRRRSPGRAALAVAGALLLLLPGAVAAQVAATVLPQQGGPADPESAGAVVVQPLESVVPNPRSKNGLPPLSAADAGFLQRLHVGLQGRLDISRLALTEGAHPCVRKLGTGLLEEYRALADELDVLAAARNVAVSERPAQDDRRLLRELQKLSGADFDRRVALSLREALVDDVDFVRQDGATLADKELKALAARVLPMMAEQLRLVRTLVPVLAGRAEVAPGAPGGLSSTGCTMF